MKRSKGLVAFVALLAGPALAHQGEARFTVSVVVPVQVTLEAVEQPSALMVTAEDVERGYKDVSARYRVRYNDRNGYLLRLAPRAGLTREVRVRGLETEVLLGDADVEIHRPATGRRSDLALDFRVMLDPFVRAGTYALPVHVAAAPL